MKYFDEIIEKFERTKDYIANNSKVLIRAYGNDYIAVLGSIVVGHSKDKFALAKTIEDKFRDSFVLIGTLDNFLSPEEDEIPSPEC